MSHVSMAEAGWQTQGHVLSGCYAADGERRFDPAAGTDQCQKACEKNQVHNGD
jgi:hypothetical protein